MGTGDNPPLPLHVGLVSIGYVPSYPSPETDTNVDDDVLVDGRTPTWIQNFGYVVMVIVCHTVCYAFFILLWYSNSDPPSSFDGFQLLMTFF